MKKSIRGKSSQGVRQALVAVYESVVQRSSRRLRRHPDEARPYLHGVVMQVLTHPSLAEQVQSWGAYLATSTINAFRGAMKKQRRTSPLSHEEPWHGKEAIDLLIAAEDRARLGKAIKELPPRQAQVLECCVAGADIGEISRMLGLSPGDVRYHKCVGIQSLRAHLGFSG